MWWVSRPTGLAQLSNTTMTSCIWLPGFVSKVASSVPTTDLVHLRCENVWLTSRRTAIVGRKCKDKPWAELRRLYNDTHTHAASLQFTNVRRTRLLNPKIAAALCKVWSGTQPIFMLWLYVQGEIKEPYFWPFHGLKVPWKSRICSQSLSCK